VSSVERSVEPPQDPGENGLNEAGSQPWNKKSWLMQRSTSIPECGMRSEQRFIQHFQGGNHGAKISENLVAAG
jgi:hypothetical protein